MAAINLFAVFSGFVSFTFIIGLHNFLTNNEENGCEMTYMFEYPQYVRLSLPSVTARRYPRYGLYAYGEGHMTERLRAMKFGGIPVLFIPGNSGSHKQVRSLASVSLRKTLSSHTPFQFDYFTVDLNEEYSALFGGVLKDQREFVHHCLHRILELYRNNANKPTSVILIGQSMGGLVAKGLFLDPNFYKNLVNIIITLVTPHRSPVLALDSFITRYYDNVNAYWRANRKAEGNLSHVTFASIGGGHRDILVRSGLTQTEEADVNILSTAVPTVWLSTDHLCSVWCKELVLVIVRTLFDIVNLTTKQVSKNVQERKSVFHYHMIQRTAGKHFSTSFHPHDVYFDYNGFWTESIQRQFTFHEPNGVFTETYIMIRLLDDPKHEMLAVEAVNNNDRDWVFACVANDVHNNVRICHTGINLSNETKFLPSRHYRRKFVYLNLAALKHKSFTHVILRVKPTKDMVQFNVDVHSSSNRHIAVSLSKWISFLSKSEVLDSTFDHAVYYELPLPGFEQTWQAYLLYIEPKSCQKAPNHALATMVVPWSKEDVHAHITETLHKPLRLRLQSPKPLSYKSGDPVKVTLILDPQCIYSVRIQSGVLDSFGQLARFYSPMLLPYLVAILLLTLREQLRTLVETGQCVMFHTALGAGAKPYYGLPAVRIGIQVVGWSMLMKIMHPLLPLPDLIMLKEQDLHSLPLCLYLYAVAYGAAYLLGLGCWLTIIFSGHTAHKMAVSFLAKALMGTLTLSEWAMTGLSKLPAAVAAFLLALIYSTCGALSLCVGAAFFFLKLCKTYENYLEHLFKYSLKLLLKRQKNSKASEREQSSVVEGDDDDRKKDDDGKTQDSMEMETQIQQNVVPDTDTQDKAETSQTDETTESAANVNDDSVKRSEEHVVRSPSDVEVSSEPNEDADFSFSEFHFNFTVFLLWLSVTLLNVPCVLVWAHNYRYNARLEPDPSFEMSLVLCFCIGILWQGNFPNPNLKYYSWVMHSLYILAVLVLTYAPLLHLLGSTITAAFVVIVLHQVLAGLVVTSALKENPSVENQLPSSMIDKDA